MTINLIIFFACYYSWGIEPSLPLLQLKKVVLYTYSQSRDKEFVFETLSQLYISPVRSIIICKQ